MTNIPGSATRTFFVEKKQDEQEPKKKSRTHNL